jgi:ribonuclease HI
MDDISCGFEINVYVDGACSNNGKENSKGGWAFIIRFDSNKKEIRAAGYAEITTNQRMELTATIKALEEIKARWPNHNASIIILSDSQYVVNGSTDWMFKWERNGWKKVNNNSPEVANLDLWKRMFELINEIRPILKWIRGHSGHEYNELCDNLATTAVTTQSDYYKVTRIPAGFIGN